MNKLMGYIYQYIVLIAVIALLTLSFVQTGTFNDMLLGALIGTVAQIPITEVTKKKKEEEEE